MQDLIIRDMRLEGPKPLGNEVLEVTPETPINWPIHWVVGKSAQYRGDVRVRIMAHAAEANRIVYGISFCTEGIHLTLPDDPTLFGHHPSAQERNSNLELFRAWHGKVKQIDLLVCFVAYIAPGYQGGYGDGNLLCSRLAQFTGAYVRASTAFQAYDSKGGRLDFGAWEGTTLTYAPSGAVARVQTFPLVRNQPLRPD